MKKDVNGVIVEMTEEEIEEIEKEVIEIPITEAERLEALESAFLELAEVLFND